MPDYEIRMFHSDGSLALVHMSHHDTDEEANAFARRVQTDLARFEVRRVGATAPGKRR